MLGLIRLPTPGFRDQTLSKGKATRLARWAIRTILPILPIGVGRATWCATSRDCNAVDSACT